MKIYITRHGRTNWNIEKKVQGKADISLNKEGIDQAYQTREKLLKENIDLIISSPLVRAKQTADLINEGREIPIIYDDRISERDFGELEGLKQDDFDFPGFWSYKRNLKYERAENIKDFFNRIYGFMDDTIFKYSDKNILLVTHGGVSIPLRTYFEGIPEDDNLLSLVIDNCEYVTYEK